MNEKKFDPKKLQKLNDPQRLMDIILIASLAMELIGRYLNPGIHGQILDTGVIIKLSIYSNY